MGSGTMDQRERERRRELFYRLAEWLSQGKFDDEYLALLADFWEGHEADEDAMIFYARYGLAHGNVDVALECGEKAYKSRKANIELWRILRDAYMARGEVGKSFLFSGRLSRHYAEKFDYQGSRKKLEENLEMLSLGMGLSNYAPFAYARMQLTEQGLEETKGMFAGQFLPALSRERNPYFVGAYAVQEQLGAKGQLLETIKDDPGMFEIVAGDFVFDLTRVRELEPQVTHPVAVPRGGAIIPISGTELRQKIDFIENGKTIEGWLDKWAFRPFRFEGEASIRSDYPVLLGNPIPLGHSPKREKVVLQILLDALPWRVVKERGYRDVPNILRFFERGVIFDDHHSVSEYTFPSVQTIETGLYPTHTHLIHEHLFETIDRDVPRISEEMKELGYYTAALGNDGSAVYTEAVSGFERLLVNSYELRAHEIVERAIQSIKALEETDQYLSLHIMNIHPWDARQFSFPTETETHVPLEAHAVRQAKKGASVYLPDDPLYEKGIVDGIHATDRAMGYLFDYVQAHYSAEEYLVVLYSDHGVSCFDNEEERYLLSERQSGAAFMLRGAGVPDLGRVEEMTSSVDVFPTIAHLTGAPMPESDGCLPKVFGGKERGYAASMSLYPGIPFRLALRTKEYDYRIESREPVDEDGRTDMTGAKRSLYRRFTTETVEDRAAWEKMESLAREFVEAVDNGGCQWPEMREKRIEWYNRKNEE